MPPRIDASRRIIIEAVSPELDCGRYAVKREVGDHLEVSADIFKDGHDAIAASIRYRAENEKVWSESRMRFVDNDRWSGSIPRQTSGDRSSSSARAEWTCRST